jgi:PAS domain S-box-containing protein
VESPLELFLEHCAEPRNEGPVERGPSLPKSFMGELEVALSPFKLFEARSMKKQDVGEADFGNSQGFSAALLEHLPLNVALLDRSGTIVAVNAAWKRFAEENELQHENYCLGCSYIEAARHADEDSSAPRLAERFESLLSGTIDEFYHDYPCHSPTLLRWFRMNVVAVNGGADRGALVTHTLITERVIAERCSQAQYEVTRTLAKSQSLEEAAPSLLETLCHCFDWEVGEIWLPGSDQKALVRKAAFGRAPERARAFLESGDFSAAHGQTWLGLLWKSGEPVVHEQLTSELFPRASLAEGAGLHTALGFPITYGGETIGVLVFFSQGARSADAMFLSSVRDLGRQVGDFIQRLEVEQALQRSEERYRLITQNASDLIVLLDSDGKYLYASPSHQRIAEVRPGSLIGRDYFDSIHPDDQNAARRMWREVQQRGRSKANVRVKHSDKSGGSKLTRA